MPDDYVHDLFFKAFWGDHGLGRSILGTNETIGRITPKILKKSFKLFFQPKRILICVVGNFRQEKLLDLVKKFFVFEGFKKNGIPKRKKPIYKSGYILQPKKLEQVHFCLGM